MDAGIEAKHARRARKSAAVEFDEVLPPQPRRNLRVVEGVVRRSARQWSGIALSADELDAVYVDSGDG